MMVGALEVHSVNRKSLNGFKKFILLVLVTLNLGTITLLYRHKSLQFPFLSSGINLPGPILPYWRNKLSPIMLSPKIFVNGSTSLTLKQKCNIFKGKWIPNPMGPYYTNSINCTIDDRQNCIKFGRPDTGFMKWRWRPNECELPLFDAAQFLELVRCKAMAFIGDSVGRNQLESLMCLLARVVHPVTQPSEGKAAKNWLYPDYNFTVTSIWSTNLVKSSYVNHDGSSPKGLLNLYLDEADDAWTTQIEHFDYVIISAGQWFSRPLIYLEKGKVIGCHNCKSKNITKLSRFYGYRMALRTTFRTILTLQGFKGMAFVRTFSPTHFGSEDWVRGKCSRKRPFRKEEMKFDPFVYEFYLTQVDEFEFIKREGMERGVRFILMDITEAMGLRPDGHPYHYGQPPNQKQLIADCLHWCLPGPIDSWNEFLLHMLKTEGK